MSAINQIKVALRKSEMIWISNFTIAKNDAPNDENYCESTNMLIVTLYK